MKVLENLLNIVFPRQCVVCGKNGEYVCKGCRKKLQVHDEICPKCHIVSSGGQVCQSCKSDVSYEGIIIGFNYSNAIQKLIFGLKYFHQKDVSSFLVYRLYLLLISHKIGNNKLVVTYVDSHWYRKYFVKGYNQSEILAKGLSDISNFRFEKTCEKYKHSRSQVKLNRKQRLKNLEGKFRMVENIKLDGDETILIVDDVTTTGSTINQLSKVIKKSYPDVKVWGLVVARHS